MRIVSVVGARSEFIKCAAVSRVLSNHHEETLIHTGQAFDYGTSHQFFSDLGLALPDHDLGISPGTHAEVTGCMLQCLAPIFKEVWPHWVLVYGSSHSTLAGSLVALKLGIPVGHIEAGVRSYKRDTPDEMNHIVVDHISKLHFCPTDKAVEALRQEGLTKGVHRVGDVLLDNVLRGFDSAVTEMKGDAFMEDCGLEMGTEFAFATIHKLENTANETRLAALIQAFSILDIPVVLPLHPRTQESLTNRPNVLGQMGPNVHIIDPLLPTETLVALSRAKVVLTDSGGLQREAYFIGVPCITLRDDTEWVETLDLSANTVVGANVETIMKAVEASAQSDGRRKKLIGRDSAFGDGKAGEHIVETLEAA